MPTIGMLVGRMLILLGGMRDNEILMKEDRLANVIPAPQWLIDRMEKLRKLPPPTLEEVRTQFSASAAFRKNYDRQEVDRPNASQS